VRHLSRAILATTVAAIVGCSADRAQVRSRAESWRRPQAVDYRVELKFDTKVSDPYVLSSSQAGERQQHWVSKRFRSGLEEYTAAKSGAASGRVVELAVTLEMVTTNYERIGGEARPVQHYAGVPLPVEVAAANGSGGLLGTRLAEGAPITFPLEITKSVVLTVVAEVRTGGTTLGRETFSVESSEVVTRDRFGPWGFSFAGVFETAIDKAIAKIDELVDKGLGK